MSRPRLPARALSLLAWVAALGASPAARADTTEVLEGDVPTSGPDHFFVPFTVPPGTREIALLPDDLSKENILDFGLEDGRGYRGWGGGTSEPIVVNAEAASRAFVPGPLDGGGFRVVVGKAKIVASPAKYRITVTYRDAPTLAPQTERRPYVPAPALAAGTRYYAGDLHVHSRESTDAAPTLDEVGTFARSRGLDFVELSDHNTVTQLDFLADVQPRHPALLFVPGIEYTTYQGHANAIGATRFVEHKLGQRGATIGAAVDAIRAQGAVFSINHPMLDLGDVCIGCAWKHDVAPDAIGAYEIGTGGQKESARLFLSVTFAAWEALLDRGSHAAPVGGSDDHRAGKGTGAFASPIGSPTTLVLADALSAEAIVAGIKKGRTVVKLQGPDDPMIALSTEHGALPGDRVGVRSSKIVAKVTGGRGQRVRFVKNGAPEAEVEVTSDPFEHALVVAPEEGRETRVRAEVVIDDLPRTVTSHVFFTRDPSGPESAAPADGDLEGGGCRTSPVGPGGLVPLALAALLAALGRRLVRPTREG